jgi:hypothetical protein
VVLLSTLVQGVSVGPLVGWLGVRADRPAWAPVAEALPIDEVDADIVEVVVTEDLPIAGRVLADVPLRRGMLMASIVRGEAVLVPRGDTQIEAGDLLLIVVEETEHSAERVTAWARGETVDEDEDVVPWPPDLGFALPRSTRRWAVVPPGRHPTRRTTTRPMRRTSAVSPGRARTPWRGGRPAVRGQAGRGRFGPGRPHGVTGPTAPSTCRRGAGPSIPSPPWLPTPC